MCFDPVAAQQIENDIQLSRFSDSINNIMIAQYDSAILVKDEQIKVITGDVKCLEIDNQALQVINQQAENKAKKEKRVSFLKGMGAGGLIIAILAIIF